ncbi:MAG: NUDIX hydrolase [Pseudomonadota bacterium]
MIELPPSAQSPMSLGNAAKSDMRTQFGALCYRLVSGKPQVLLITSRTRGRWIIPKGWPVEGLTPAQSAEREAWEEAGVKGRINSVCLGMYSYNKEIAPGDFLPCMVAVFPLKVKTIAEQFPEVSERRRKWYSLPKAARKSDGAELGNIISHFDPRMFR